MSVSAIVPYREADAHRARARAWVEERLAGLGIEVVRAEDTEADGPWSKPRLILDGLRRASGEIVVVHDADSWCEATPLAVRAVASGYPWAVPHRQVRRLSAEATADVLAGRAPDEKMALARRAYRGLAAGGILALPRETALAVPPDPRFEGWGCEDGAWRDALRCLVGMEWRQSRAPLYHLWHPPAKRGPGNVSHPANVALAARYSAVRRARDPEAMRSLVAEGHSTVPGVLLGVVS